MRNDATICKKSVSFTIKLMSIDPNEMKKILVICIGNSCRSQMAHGYLTRFAPAGTEIYSAGIEPDGLNPRAVATMLEDGIDISHHTSNAVAEYAESHFDFVITLCDSAKERCTALPPNNVDLHQHFLDPWHASGTEEEIQAVFRLVRDQLKAYSNEFVINYLGSPS